MRAAPPAKPASRLSPAKSVKASDAGFLAIHIHKLEPEVATTNDLAEWAWHSQLTQSWAD